MRVHHIAIPLAIMFAATGLSAQDVPAKPATPPDTSKAAKSASTKGKGAPVDAKGTIDKGVTKPAKPSDKPADKPKKPQLFLG